MTPYGYCGYKFISQSAYITTSFNLFYVLILIVASSIFLRYITKIENKNYLTTGYIKYYFCFLIVFCVNQIFITISQFLVNYTCISEIKGGLFNVAKTTANCCASISPIFVFVIISTNGKNAKLAFLKIVKCLHTTFQKIKLKTNIKKKVPGEERLSFY